MQSTEEVKKRSLDNEVPIIFEDTARELRKSIADKKPKRILEIGGGTGYSACVMLSACGDCHLTSIEKNPYRYNLLNDAIAPHRAILGDAHTIMQELIQNKETFDFVFIDGPKAQYGKYFDLIEKLLIIGGSVFADNMNFHGMTNGRTEVTAGARSIVRGLQDFINKIKEKGYPTQNIDDGDGIIIYTKNK